MAVPLTSFNGHSLGVPSALETNDMNRSSRSLVIIFLGQNLGPALGAPWVAVTLDPVPSRPAPPFQPGIDLDGARAGVAHEHVVAVEALGRGLVGAHGPTSIFRRTAIQTTTRRRRMYSPAGSPSRRATSRPSHCPSRWTSRMGASQSCVYVTGAPPRPRRGTQTCATGADP